MCDFAIAPNGIRAGKPWERAVESAICDLHNFQRAVSTRGLQSALECCEIKIPAAEKKKPRFRGALNVRHRGAGGLGRCRSVPVLMRPRAHRSPAERGILLHRIVVRGGGQ